MEKVTLQRKLNTFDVTNLVVGSIIGADIYVATAISARLVGPSSLLLWIIAGVMAMVIAMSFAYCVMIHPKVGGPYAYAREVSTPVIGFEVGWALLLAEWFSLAVFPVAFAQYFVALVPGVDDLGRAVLKGVFIVIILVTNLIGAKAAGRTNDVLTITKLSPLLLIVLGGMAFLLWQPSTASSNLVPFFNGDAAAYGQALVLIFWAYAGFELSTLPTNDMERPETTVPRAIVLGMLIVIVFYLLTNFVVIGAVSQTVISSSSSPLLAAAGSIFSPVPLFTNAIVLIVGVGALLSILGADESGTIGTSRLTYAMSADGLLPHALSKMSPRFGTPYLALIAICSTAFIASLIGGLTALINSSVFLLAFVYLATCISALLLARRHPETASKIRMRPSVMVAGAGLSIVLMLLVDPAIMVISLILLGVGIPIYIFFSPKKELAEVKAEFLSRESMLHRAYHQSWRFLAYPLQWLKLLYYNRTGKQRALVVKDREHELEEEIVQRK